MSPNCSYPKCSSGTWYYHLLIFCSQHCHILKSVLSGTHTSGTPNKVALAFDVYPEVEIPQSLNTTKPSLFSLSTIRTGPCTSLFAPSLGFYFLSGMLRSSLPIPTKTSEVIAYDSWNKVLNSFVCLSSCKG